MPYRDISKIDTSNLSTEVDDFSVDTETTDALNEYTNSNWTQQLGYYKKIPELAIAIDAKATWTVGKGFNSDEETEVILSAIRGWGKDTFNTIIENMIRTYHIGGDAFAEAMFDNEGYLINLKPLDPSTMKIIADDKGVITGYEQISKKSNIKFSPKDIFHLARNRVADEIHGVSIIDAVEEIILARNEAIADWKTILHRNVPVRVLEVDSDDTTRLNTLKAEYAAAIKNKEVLIIPKGTVEVGRDVATAGQSNLYPVPWIELLNQYFYQAVGVPDIIVGSSKTLTEASAKIAYLAFQQTIEEEQLFIEEQVLSQLKLKIELAFPASLENELLSGTPKKETMTPTAPQVEQEQAFQPNDTTAEMQGRR